MNESPYSRLRSHQHHGEQRKRGAVKVFWLFDHDSDETKRNGCQRQRSGGQYHVTDLRPAHRAKPSPALPGIARCSAPSQD